MDNETFPITPPPELVQQWWKNAQRADYSDGLPCWLNYVATQAARWGADQELEACVELLTCRYGEDSSVMNLLRAARRPKPPSLKEQALASVKRLEESGEFFSDQMRELAFIRKALEQFND